MTTYFSTDPAQLDIWHAANTENGLTVHISISVSSTAASPTNGATPKTSTRARRSPLSGATEAPNARRSHRPAPATSPATSPNTGHAPTPTPTASNAGRPSSTSADDRRSASRGSANTPTTSPKDLSIFQEAKRLLSRGITAKKSRTRSTSSTSANASKPRRHNKNSPTPTHNQKQSATKKARPASRRPSASISNNKPKK